MKNGHSNLLLISGLQGNLSDVSRVCSRHNKGPITDRLGDVDVVCYSTKLDLTDYGYNLSQFSAMNFVLRIMQVVPVNRDDATRDTLGTMMSDTIDCIARNDGTFKIFGSVSDALKHSGLNSSFIYALRDIINCVADASASLGNPVTGIQYVSSAIFSNPSVGMVFVYAGSVIVLQFSD